MDADEALKTSRLTSRFEDAFVFTAQLHAKQLKKGTHIPYIAHLMSVASLVITHGGNENEAIAGLLHDAVEDQGGKPTLETIRTRFGDMVATIVEGCSDTDVVPKPPYKPRKEAYLAHLKVASPSVKLVVAADKLDNVRAILTDHRTYGSALWSRFNAGVRDQKWFYRGCVTTLQGGPAPLVRELDLAVLELERIEEA